MKKRRHGMSRQGHIGDDDAAFYADDADSGESFDDDYTDSAFDDPTGDTSSDDSMSFDDSPYYDPSEGYDDGGYGGGGGQWADSGDADDDSGGGGGGGGGGDSGGGGGGGGPSGGGTPAGSQSVPSAKTTALAPTKPGFLGSLLGPKSAAVVPTTAVTKAAVDLTPLQTNKKARDMVLGKIAKAASASTPRTTIHVATGAGKPAASAVTAIPHAATTSAHAPMTIVPVSHPVVQPRPVQRIVPSASARAQILRGKK